MKSRAPRIGDVIQIAIPGGFAYGRVLRDASVAFYRQFSLVAGQPPLGSRDYLFVVGVYADALASQDAPVVGHDPSHGPEDDWPPPTSITDPISGEVKIYHYGVIRDAQTSEVLGLEPAAVWDLQHIGRRLMGSQRHRLDQRIEIGPP